MKIAFIDYDGTIVRDSFPSVGIALPHAFRVMKRLKAESWKLVLWTCRENHILDPKKQYLTQAVDFCLQNGVVFDAVNEGFEYYDFRDPTEYKLRRKPHGHVVIDDRNLGGFPGWLEVERILCLDENF